MHLKQGAVFDLTILKNIKILTVDNDNDSGALYNALFEPYGIKVITPESIKEALNLLNHFTPDIIVCEARFLGESVYPLMQKVNSIAQNRHKVIPIFVTSTCPAIDFAKNLEIRVEAYQTKPIDLDRFVDEIWRLLFKAEQTTAREK